MDASADKRLLTRIDEFGQNLSEWEVEFVESCLKRLETGQPLTDKQRAIAERLDEEKVE